MNVIIGSARIDENGKLQGGAPGDQKQNTAPDTKGEVSQQNFYVHKKGWYVLRPKSAATGEKLSKAMIYACNNKNIGYDQLKRLDIIKDGTHSNKPTSCDCSSLVRICVIEATGIDPGNFDTSAEKAKLLKTDLFDCYEYTPGAKLVTGSVLVTKTKGHTAIVTLGETNTEETTRPTIRYGSRGEDVLYLHKQLKKLRYGVNVKSDYFDSVTKNCVINLQASNPGLEVDGVVGPCTWAIVDSIK